MNWLKAFLRFGKKVMVADATADTKVVSFDSPEGRELVATMTDEERSLYEEYLAATQELQRVFNRLPECENSDRATVYEAALLGCRMLDRIEMVITTCDKIGYEKLTEHRNLLREYEMWFHPLHTPIHPEGKLVAIVDTETTGVSSTDEPISVGIILLEVSGDDGRLLREVDSYYGLRKPAVPIHPQAQEVHGMTPSQLEGHAFDLTRLHQLLYSAQCVVAHNAAFDRRMLARVKPKVENLTWLCSMNALSPEWGCIAGSRSLQAICDALGIARQEPHNALDDCRALQAVLQCKAGATLLMAKLLASAQETRSASTA